MARIGAFCFPGTGHINPMTALARRLQSRGHHVILFGIADTEARIRAAGVDFRLIGAQDYPLGTLPALDKRLSELKGLATFRFTVDRVKNTAAMVLRDGPEAVRQANLDALLIDEADMAGTVAEHLGLPFVSIAFFPPLRRDDCIPPFCFHWSGNRHWLSRFRNRLGQQLLRWIAKPIYTLVNRQRAAWGLAPLRHTVDALSPLAQITQLPQALEFSSAFASAAPLANLHYVGPFIDQRVRPPVPFPWERLDARPLIYASLGTLQNGSEAIFRIIAEACSPIDAQLVLSLGGGLTPEALGPLPGNPLIVTYAPQLEILKKAAVVITHAGLNTVLEALSEGVPLIALPLGNDQPGVAARIASHGTGIAIPRSKLTAARLRAALVAVLEDAFYRNAAIALQQAIRQSDPLEDAANIIEQSLSLSAS